MAVRVRDTYPVRNYLEVTGAELPPNVEFSKVHIDFLSQYDKFHGLVLIGRTLPLAQPKDSWWAGLSTMMRSRSP